MTRGKHICKILKEIRKQIAEANDIEFVTSKCNYKGDCLGTCPKCEAEVRYLEQQLHARRLVGKAVTIAGISIGTSSMLPLYSMAQEQSRFSELLGDVSVVENNEETHVLSGKVFGMDGRGGLGGAVVHNLSALKTVYADKDGNFEIDVCPGDSVEFSYVGYNSKIVSVEGTSGILMVELTSETISDTVSTTPAFIMGGLPIGPTPIYKELELRVIDENNNPIDLTTLENVDISILQTFKNESGIMISEVSCITLFDDADEDNKIYRLQWTEVRNHKKVVLRIRIDGYEDFLIPNPKSGNKTIVLKPSQSTTESDVWKYMYDE